MTRIPALLFALLATTLVGSYLVSPVRGAHPKPQEKRLAIRGHLDDWRLESDGTLYISVIPQAMKVGGEGLTEAGSNKEIDSGPVWFRTPAQQTSKVQFEQLIFEALLQTREGDSRLRAMTFFGRLEPGLDGSEMKMAYPIAALGRG